MKSAGASLKLTRFNDKFEVLFLEYFHCMKMSFIGNHFFFLLNIIISQCKVNGHRCIVMDKTTKTLYKSTSH